MASRRRVRTRCAGKTAAPLAKRKVARGVGLATQREARGPVREGARRALTSYSGVGRVVMVGIGPGTVEVPKCESDKHEA
jgi:hypothetical protein